MTKQDAIAAMIAGKKVTHKYFSREEYMTMDLSLLVITEDGYSRTLYEFFRYRKSHEWEDGYSEWIPLSNNL